MARYDRKDHFYNCAKEEGFRSRASYKLLELQESYKIFKKTSKVLDLGSFPGGWIQVAARFVGSSGVITGVDLKQVQPLKKSENLSGVPLKIFLGDVRDPELQAQILTSVVGGYDVVMSDMSPNLTGIVGQDQARTAEILRLAFELNNTFLRHGGVFIAKAFPSEETEEIYRQFRVSFDRLDRTCLKSTRQTSNELYFIGKGFRRRQKKEEIAEDGKIAKLD